ncbi:MAG: DNA repair protein RadA [Candidatus Gracilibacteria bacterium]|nr:DNA repair protein RadA [Candidatus Gracilibacteria bacterium]
MKIKTIYVCSSCNEQTTKWTGKCMRCGAWDSLIEDAVDSESHKLIETKSIEVRKVSLEDSFSKRITSGIEEFDRVLGGGIVGDGLLLLTGDPGIGKSTLSLQVSLEMAKSGKKVLYVSGEESVDQISMRARRIFKQEIPESFSLVNAHHLESVVATIKKHKPDLVIADSVQTLSSEKVSGMPGSIVQTRHIAEVFMDVAKRDGIPVILIGHVTKDGGLAGPKVLEHLVDTVLFFEGDRYQNLRMLRALKNRFGSTNEVGIFSMKEEGLVEVKNPSEIFLKGRKSGAIGSALSVTLEGTRPFVLEIQALTNSADYSYPKRAASGMDGNRVQLLTAVLNKHAKLKMDQQDVYVNVAGGFRVRDPAVDLALVAAIISSRNDSPLPEQVALIGEVGLSAEVRPVSHEEKRLKELAKLGFKEVWGNIEKKIDGLMVKKVTDIHDLMKLLK